MITEKDIQLFLDFLSIDSTTGRERAGAEWLATHLKTPGNRVETHEVGDGSLNVLLSWGTPKVYFCSHCDTVPPYIPPTLREDRIEGRGSCDASWKRAIPGRRSSWRKAAMKPWRRLTCTDT